MIDLINRMTEDLRGKVRLMVGRAVIAVINDSGPIQTAQAQLLADEVQDDAERIQEYGFTSVPLSGAEAVVAFVGGNRDHGLIIAVDDRRYRLKGLPGGEVAIYDDQGQKVHLTRDGIVIDGAGKDVTIQNAPTVHMGGNLAVAGNIIAQGDVSDHGNKSMAAMRNAYNTHKGHTLPGSNPDQGM
jgi:phage gp45-like